MEFIIYLKSIIFKLITLYSSKIILAQNKSNNFETLKIIKIDQPCKIILICYF